VAADYEVTSIRQTQALSAGGNLVDEVEASFVTIPEGASGLVRVPRSGAWSDALTAAIVAEVAQLKAVFTG
jgi:hypothetical protein